MSGHRFAVVRDENPPSFGGDSQYLWIWQSSYAALGRREKIDGGLAKPQSRNNILVKIAAMNVGLKAPA